MDETMAKWAERVAEWKAGGLTSAAYCEGKVFTAGGLRLWAHRPGGAQRGALCLLWKEARRDQGAVLRRHGDVRFLQATRPRDLPASRSARRARDERDHRGGRLGRPARRYRCRGEGLGGAVAA